MTTPFLGLAAIRAQLADLIAEIDTAELPAPHHIRAGDKRADPINAEPGASWEPAHAIKVFTVDTKDGQGAVFVSDTRWGWMDRADWEAFNTDDARRLGMALLAAAKWVDDRRPTTAPPDNIRTLRKAAS